MAAPVAAVPDVAVLVVDQPVRAAAHRDREFLHLAGLGIEAAEQVGELARPPDHAVRRRQGIMRTRARRRRGPDLELHIGGTRDDVRLGTVEPAIVGNQVVRNLRHLGLGDGRPGGLHHFDGLAPLLGVLVVVHDAPQIVAADAIFLDRLHRSPWLERKAARLARIGLYGLRQGITGKGSTRRHHGNEKRLVQHQVHLRRRGRTKKPGAAACCDALPHISAGTMAAPWAPPSVSCAPASDWRISRLVTPTR